MFLLCIEFCAVFSKHLAGLNVVFWGSCVCVVQVLFRLDVTCF